MAFGHWMEINEGDVRLRLGPIRREEAKQYVAAEAGYGMQSYEVMRYLGGGMAPTEQGEEEWWDKHSKDEGGLMWGIYVPGPSGADGEDPTWKLIGSTSLHFHRDRRRAESGFMIFDRAFWRQRIASTAHLGRTQYAFQELDLLAITSVAFVPNEGSNRALQGVGYVKTGTTYGDCVVGGRMIDTNTYLMPNPADEAWRYFWRRPDDEIPQEFFAGRERTLGTLARAEAAVKFL